MIGSIILVALGILILIGLGESVLKDFGIPGIAMVVLIALIVGLNFIPEIRLGGFTFSVGTAILCLSCLSLFLFKGKIVNKIIAILITAVMTGLMYGATRLALLYGNTFWSQMNVFWGLIAGFLALLLARNGKYSFICAVISIIATSLLVQIGGNISLNAAFDWAVVAGALSVVLYTVIVRLMPSRPNKFSYYIEAAKMKD